MADLKYIGKNILNHDLILKKGDINFIPSLATLGLFGSCASAPIVPEDACPVT